MKLGNVSEAQMPLHVLLSRLYSVIDKSIVELNISTQNWILRPFNFSFNGKDTYSLDGADDFGTPVLVEVAEYPGGIYVPVEMINRTNIRLAQESSKAAAAFDTVDGSLQIHFTIPSYSGVARVWYEPDTPTPRQLDANVPLKNLFRNYVTSEVALLCLPYVNYPTSVNSDFKSQLKDSLMADIVGLPPDYEGGWREAWQLEITRAKIQGRATKIPFRAGC